jgi:hypothetical protein
VNTRGGAVDGVGGFTTRGGAGAEAAAVVEGAGAEAAVAGAGAEVAVEGAGAVAVVAEGGGVAGECVAKCKIGTCDCVQLIHISLRGTQSAVK